MEESFTFRNMRGMASTMARSSSASVTQLRQLLVDRGPRLAAGCDASNVVLNANGRSAVICTGVYLLESGGKHMDVCLPYLLEVFAALPDLHWTEESVSCSRGDRIPTYEKFTLCLSTILSDIAARWPEHRDKIVAEQMELVSALVAEIEHVCDTETLDFPHKVLLLQHTCMLMGILRSLGRYSAPFERADGDDAAGADGRPDEDILPLICRVFPCPFDLAPVKNGEGAHERGSDTAKRQESLKKAQMHVIHSRRSLSPLAAGRVHCTAVVPAGSASSTALMRDPLYVSYQKQSIPIAHYLFGMHVTSFCAVNCLASSEDLDQNGYRDMGWEAAFPLRLTPHELLDVLNLARRLLTKKLLDRLDNHATDVYVVGH